MKQQPPNKTLNTLRLIAALLFVVIVQLGVLMALQVNEAVRRSTAPLSTLPLPSWEINGTNTAGYEAQYSELRTQGYIQRLTDPPQIDITTFPLTLTARVATSVDDASLTATAAP